MECPDKSHSGQNTRMREFGSSAQIRVTSELARDLIIIFRFCLSVALRDAPVAERKKEKRPQVPRDVTSCFQEGHN